MQVISNKELLMDELANVILGEIATKSGTESLAVWKDINMVMDQIKGSLETDIDPTKLKD